MSFFKRKVATMPPKKFNLGPHALKQPIKATYNGAKVLIVARDAEAGTAVIKHGERHESVRIANLNVQA